MARENSGREPSTQPLSPTNDAGSKGARSEATPIQPNKATPGSPLEKPAPTRAISFVEHLRFFDSDQNQRLSIEEGWNGLERLGFGRLLARPGAVGINLGLAGLGLLQGRLVNPASLPLPETSRIRHPDTELVDADGNFVQARLDAVFDKYAKRFPGAAMTLPELVRFVGARAIREARRGLADAVLLPVGLSAMAAEWGALFFVAAVEREGLRVLEKSAVRRFYTDPKFFYEVADRVEAERARRGRSLFGSARNLVQTWVI